MLGESLLGGLFGSMGEAVGSALGFKDAGREFGIGVARVAGGLAGNVAGRAAGREVARMTAERLFVQSTRTGVTAECFEYVYATPFQRVGSHTIVLCLQYVSEVTPLLLQVIVGPVYSFTFAHSLRFHSHPHPAPYTPPYRVSPRLLRIPLEERDRLTESELSSYYRKASLVHHPDK
jgi:hypothetical protein